NNRAKKVFVNKNRTRLQNTLERTNKWKSVIMNYLNEVKGKRIRNRKNHQKAYFFGDCFGQ
ncbi:hypothetical protein, partial [Ectobacillus panaciterrae]|uniref:hypothetical protein n=1 Tax=Ectobacillus panaciterrae TaxID=363872 RepID=UPI000490421B